MEIISIFGNLSFALSALSFLMHDMSRLRMIAIISALFGIFYNYNVTDSPLWLVIFWLSTFLGINLSMLATEYFRNKSAKFDANEQELFETLFSELSAFEFLQLLKAGSWTSLRSQERFIIAQQKNVKLGLIWRGQAKVLKGKEGCCTFKKRNAHWRNLFSNRRKTKCRCCAGKREPCVDLGSRKIETVDIKKS